MLNLLKIINIFYKGGKIMALKNLKAWNSKSSALKASACGASDGDNKPSACGAGDGGNKPSACGASGK